MQRRQTLDGPVRVKVKLGGWRSSTTGETVREALDVAHLPGSSWRAGGNIALDGILLSTVLHRPVDADLLQIADGEVRVSDGT